MRTQEVRCGGLRLRIHRIGEGAPLLLINGIGASLEMWGPLLPHLPDRQIIAFDLLGAGRSSTPRVPLRIRGIAAVVAELLSKLGVARADVLGYSFGGVVAQELAHRHRRVVDRLILAATSAGWPSWPPSPLVTWLMLTPARYYDRHVATVIVPVIAGGRIARDRSILRASIERRLSCPPSAVGYFHQLYAVTGWTSQPWLRRLEHRTLVLHGDEDPIVSVMNARLMARCIPRGTLLEIPRAGHMFLYDEPERAGREISRFLSRDSCARAAAAAPEVGAESAESVASRERSPAGAADFAPGSRGRARSLDTPQAARLTADGSKTTSDTSTSASEFLMLRRCHAGMSAARTYRRSQS